MLSYQYYTYYKLFANELEKQDDEYMDDYGWMNLPDILLEDILALVEPKVRHVASQVCRTWYHSFYAPRVWDTFILKERTLTKRRYNLFKSYQRELCPKKTQDCLAQVGSFFKRIIVTPICDFYNLHEFLRVLGVFLDFFDVFPMPMLHTFHFTFACETRGINGIGTMIHGTGGQILEALNTLIGNMQTLHSLTVNQLLLSEEDVPSFFEAAGRYAAKTVRHLEILNCTKSPYPLLELARFEYLQRLVISPQHIDDEVILLLASSGLPDLHIVQEKYTCYTEPVSADAWRMVKQLAPYLKVTLNITGQTREQLLLQPHAPVKAIIYDTPYLKLTASATMDIVHFYSKTLETFSEKCLPRAFGSRSFHSRGDASFLMLVRQCPRLQTLVINERISTATLLLLNLHGRALRRLVVRQNALLKRSDWPRSDWSAEFYRDFRYKSRSYDRVNEELRKKFDEWPWRPLTDKEFKRCV